MTEWVLSKEFAGNAALSEESAGVLYALHCEGGAVYDRPNMTAVDQLRKHAHYSISAVKTLVDRDLVKIFKTHPKRKRISGYELTDKGKWAAKNLTFTQQVNVRLSKVLSDLREVAFDQPRTATDTLVRLTHSSNSTVRHVLMGLIADGKVEVEWNGDSQTYPRRLKWVGGSPPGHHVENFDPDATPASNTPEEPQTKAAPAKEKQMPSKIIPSNETALNDASVDELLDALIEKMGQSQTNKAVDEFVEGVRDVIKKAHSGDMSPFLALAQLETVLKTYDGAVA